MGVCGAKNNGAKGSDQPPVKLKGALKDPNKPAGEGEVNPELADKQPHPEKVVAFAPDVMEREREKDGTDKKDSADGGDLNPKDADKPALDGKEPPKPENSNKTEMGEKTGDQKEPNKGEGVKPAADKAKAIGDDLKKIANENQPHFSNLEKDKGLTNTGQTSKSSVSQAQDPELIKRREKALQELKNMKQTEAKPLNAKDIPIIVTDDVR